MSLFDVIAVDIKTNKVRIIASDKAASSAEAIENMAVMRRGVDEEFFVTVPAHRYKDNDEWVGVE